MKVHAGSATARRSVYSEEIRIPHMGGFKSLRHWESTGLLRGLELGVGLSNLNKLELPQPGSRRERGTEGRVDGTHIRAATPESSRLARLAGRSLTHMPFSARHFLKISTEIVHKLHSPSALLT